MLNKIEKLSKIFNNNSNNELLCKSLQIFFEENFSIEEFAILPDADNAPLCYEYLYPLLCKNKTCLWFLGFSKKTQELEAFLDICAPFISLKIENIMLNNRMQKDINFYDTMKNIAKIIETQYELNYIVPIIGEMLDKFFPNYLIYLFLRNEDLDVNVLSWPLACKDENILSMVKEGKEVARTQDGKIITLPLVSEGKYVGVIAAKSMENAVTAKDEEYLQQLSGQIAITIQRANVYAEILKHATLDALTGFYNRHQLEERIKQEVSNAKRQHAPLCGIMTDIDYFKRVNDTYGHAVGDLVLKTIAKVIRSQLREYDIAGRYGGEEFSILLPFTKINEAYMVAERLRKTIEKKSIDISKTNPDADVKKLSITISLGIYEIKETDSDEDLLKKADKALYQAKNTGRNKVVINED